MMPIDFHKGFVVAVDPGLRGCGLAVFRDGALHRAEYVRNRNETERGPVAHMQMAESVGRACGEHITDADVVAMQLLVEFPQIYPGAGKAIDPNDLLDVAGVATACMTHVATMYLIPDASCRWTLPHAWKGNIKKEIMTERIRNSLTANERGLVVSAGAKDHNTLDAIGLGLWQLGRLNRKVYS